MDILITSCFAGGMLTLLYGIIETKLLKVKEYTYKSEKVPEELKGKKLALISDVHGIYHGKDNARLFDKLSSINPDCIVICGDLVNGRGEKELKYAFHFLRKVRKLKIPVIYTFGNHEEKLRKKHRRACKKLIRFSNRRIFLLNNRAVKINGFGNTVFTGLNLPLWMYHGRDTDGILKKRTDKILSKLNTDSSFKILIAHDPEHIKEYAESGYDLCLSGHLHGGIVYLPYIGGIVTPRFQLFKKEVKGLHECGNMKMIISGGVGWHDIPVRLFNRPEIVVVHFDKDS